MSIPYDQTGRTQQKARTRQALVEAARGLISSGVTPTVEQAAEYAGISRTTAYRYFGSQRALLVAAHPYLDRPSLLPADAPMDAEGRLATVVDAHTAQTLENEHQLRTMLRLSLDPTADREQLLLRRGRAIGWLREAVEPAGDRLSEEELNRLVLAIRTVEGIEALVWLTDVAGLSRSEARELMAWAAVALLRSALAHEPPPTGQARDR